MKLNTTKWLGIAIVTFTVFSGILFFVARALTQDAAALEEVLQTLASEQAVMQEQQALKQILDQTAEVREELGSYIISGESGTVTFLSTIDTMAAQLGIVLTTSRLEVENSADGPYDTLAVMFSIEGDETAVLRALRLFETLPYRGAVTDVQINRTSDVATGRAQMKGTVSLSLSIITS